jgi:glycolate oxidase FAD binding subunit
MVIGVTVALADGTVCKAGGQVVKNVAGYDLCKLFTGSLGTLGVLVSVNFKVFPRPKVSRLVHGTFETPAGAFKCARDLLRVSQYYSFILVEAAGAAAASHVWALAEGFSGVLELQIAAARERVATRQGAIEILAGAEVHEAVARLVVCRESSRDDGLLLRGAVKPAQLEYVWEAAGAALPEDCFMRLIGDAITGTYSIACRRPGDNAVMALALGEARAALRAIGGHLTVSGGEPALRAGLDPWGATSGGEALSRLIKSRLDPAGILNPGRHAFGI